MSANSLKNITCNSLFWVLDSEISIRLGWKQRTVRTVERGKRQQTMNGAQDEKRFQSVFKMRTNLGNTVGPNPFVVCTASPNED